MGPEMGHYVLNHSYKGVVMTRVVVAIGFAFVNWGISFALARWGQRWGVQGIGDVAVLPLAVVLFSGYLFLMTPVNNTITRSMEYEADMYGLNSARQPGGQCGSAARRVPQDGAGTNGGVYLFRPCQRAHAHYRGNRWKAEYQETASAAEMARPFQSAQ
jgi:Zn-dependent protease with chaperone function